MPVGTGLRVVGRVQAMLQIGRVVGIRCGVAGYPLPGWAMAALAAHAIGDLVAGVSALGCWVVGVAVQAFLGLVGRLRQAQFTGNAA